MAMIAFADIYVSPRKEKNRIKSNERNLTEYFIISRFDTFSLNITVETEFAARKFYVTENVLKNLIHYLTDGQIKLLNQNKSEIMRTDTCS